MTDIDFGHCTQSGAYGRNGPFQQSGLAITGVGEEIVIEGITSRGEVSSSATLSIPFNMIDAVIEALKLEKSRFHTFSKLAENEP